jgi:hypothetical protein
VQEDQQLKNDNEDLNSLVVLAVETFDRSSGIARFGLSTLASDVRRTLL